MRSLAVTPLGLLLLAACAQGPARETPAESVEPDAAAVAQPAQGIAGDADKGAVLGHIETRDNKMTIHSGILGPRFTVADKQGRVLATGLSAEQLAKSQPELHRVYKSSTAGSSLDARVDDPIRDPDPVMGDQPRRFETR